MIKLISGSKTVALAATPEALSTTLSTEGLAISAKPTNTNRVFVGDSVAQDFSLVAGEKFYFSDLLNFKEEPVNLADIFIRVTTNGEGVNYLYTDRRLT